MFNKLTQADLEFAIKMVDDIVDNTDKSEIESKIKNFVEERYDGDKKRQFLVHLNSLFGNVILNELTFRCDDAEERSLIARFATKKLNNR